jgi:hypothetical protein
MAARHWPWMFAALLFLAASGAGAIAEAQSAADAEATPPPAMTFPPLNKGADEAPPTPYFVNPFPGTPQFYSTSFGVWSSGAQQVVWTNNLFESPQNLPWGGPLATANFQSSVTYRYAGLFGGIIRPVARFSVGAGPMLTGVGRRTFGGVADAWTPYAMPEAGLEIVYKGVGVGMTVSYPLIVEPYDAGKKFTGGWMPARFRREQLDWGQLIKNIYLILE